MKRAIAAISVLLGMLFIGAGAFAEMQALDAAKLKPDLSPFLAAGCVDNDQAKGFVCPPELAKRFGCADLALARNLGGIDMPVALCRMPRKTAGKPAAKGAKEESFVANSGCLMSEPIRYVVYTTKGFKVAKSRDEFIKLVAPIDSAEKAASLVMALSTHVSTSLPSDSDRYVVKTRDKEFRTASAERRDGNFVLRLFESSFCGCGPHPTSAVDYEVSPSGAVRELSRRIVMEMKGEICVD